MKTSDLGTVQVGLSSKNHQKMILQLITHGPSNDPASCGPSGCAGGGAAVEERNPSGPGRRGPGPASDHRIAMAFAVAGLRTAGTTLDDATCVGKSNPSFWSQLERL